MGWWERIYKESDGERLDGPTVTEAVVDAQPWFEAGRRAKVVDLRTGRASAHVPEVWGRPGRCPVCAGIGYLDRIDLVHRTQHERCTECGHTWSVTEAETLPAS